MKYQSELIKEIIDTRGHEKSSLHYQSECVETWIEENKGAYPKLTDYQGEWLNYINENPIGKFPYLALTDVTNATIDNVVPLAYKSAILKGNSEVVAGKNKCNMEEIQKGWLDGSSGEVISNAGVYIPVKVSGTITISNFIHDKSRYVYEYDVSGNYLGRNSVTTNTVTLSLNENTILIKIAFYDARLSVVKSLELQVEQGEVATEYEPYNSTLVSVKMPVLTTSNEDGTKTNILTVNEDVTLRSNGSVYDELDLLTGKLTQRIDENGEVLSQEIVKTVDLTIINQDGETLTKIIPIEGTMNISTDGTPIKPTITMEIPVEAITQNLASFIDLEMEE